MKVEQRVWRAGAGWSDREAAPLGDVQLVLLFGGTDSMADDDWLRGVEAAYPQATLFGCSTAGEIVGTRVLDDSVVSSAVHFDSTTFAVARVDLDTVAGDSRRAGEALAEKLSASGLTHVFVLSDGQAVNGSQLVRGMLERLPSGVQLTGGMAGDGARFHKTLVLADGALRQNCVAAIGFYGDSLRVGCGSLGGWDAFGPIRQVTRSAGNVLFELDDRPALELYKRYLGEHASGLPATGLLFPLQVRVQDADEPLVRTILSVDERDQSLTFAGDVPEGALAQLMKANFDRLIEGAEGAATASASGLDGAELAILISCVGRKLVLKQRTEEEVEAVRDVLGAEAALAGFYSYGEICPAAPHAGCQLHNQTMTITTFREV